VSRICIKNYIFQNIQAKPYKEIMESWYFAE